MEFLLERVEEQVRFVETFEARLEIASMDGQIDGETQTRAYL